MDNWDEIRTAFQVARLGTVSGAAEVLGVHHATVIRHIDALEKRLGAKLFQRHARGYTPTEAGRDLLSVAQTTEDQFAQLASRIKGQGEVVSGELLVTAITGIADLISPVFAGFEAAHPQVLIRFLTDMRVFRLDYGEAHVAIRAGSQPQEPDYVVQPLTRLRTALYASRTYVEAHGTPTGIEDLARHRLICHDNPESRAPFYRWLRAHVPDEAITFRITESEAAYEAVRAGLGIGFLPFRIGSTDPGLVEVMPPQSDWDSPLWIVTHVDLHRTLKVQSFLTHLRAAAAGWASA
ncbi:LysR family transcriptional regulator [Gemmobacter aquaticus]|uniref:LysR family transcriptional regulator n=1 Tax=Gemmobacter aquaticus TaxID=490185 RepID=A0A917YLE4_9RHOB|nr:LysR family transcriptional regulator [Gemmobacter aquaticus]GGO34712.1 LysR family transcriptional regulator [Gemmobacter aquaticus]